MILFKKELIRGCEARGDYHSPYLTRLILLKTEKLSIYLHKFHRSDADDLHDHPWNFLSFILWRGYNEYYIDERGAISRRRVWPGQIIYRPAEHAHRVVLIDNKPAYTLVIHGPYVRLWGFYVRGKWQFFRDYFFKMGC